MAISLNTNLPALNSLRNLGEAQESLGSTLEKLSSGKRVNSAKDDAAASATIERFAAQIAGNNQAIRNLNDGISQAQVADGAIGQIQSNTQRIRELAVASANGTLAASDRAALQAEASQLQEANADILKNTQFNGQSVLQSNSQTLQAGPNAGNQLEITGVSLSGNGGGNGLYTANGQIDLSTASGATEALKQLDADISRLSTVSANYGAIQNRIEASIANQSTAAINQAAAKSRIGDTDYASTTSNLALAQIRNQAALAVQAQANATPQQVLSLLRS